MLVPHLPFKRLFVLSICARSQQLTHLSSNDEQWKVPHLILNLPEVTRFLCKQRWSWWVEVPWPCTASVFLKLLLFQNEHSFLASFTLTAVVHSFSSNTRPILNSLLRYITFISAVQHPDETSCVLCTQGPGENPTGRLTYAEQPVTLTWKDLTVVSSSGLIYLPEPSRIKPSRMLS